jgi:hypothetical protein
MQEAHFLQSTFDGAKFLCVKVAVEIASSLRKFDLKFASRFANKALGIFNGN